MLSVAINDDYRTDGGRRSTLRVFGSEYATQMIELCVDAVSTYSWQATIEKPVYIDFNRDWPGNGQYGGARLLGFHFGDHFDFDAERPGQFAHFDCTASRVRVTHVFAVHVVDSVVVVHISHEYGGLDDAVE